MVDLFYFVITTIQPFNYLIEPCTGTRIRTQIKGFGDPYATIAPYPYKAISDALSAASKSI